jgi:hypothetical protein
MTGLDHVFLDIRSKTVLGPKNRVESRSRMRGQTIDDVNELVIDGSGVTNDADPLSVEARRVEEAFGSQRDAHTEIIIQKMH